LLESENTARKLVKLSCMCIDVKENRREFFSTQSDLL